MCLALASTAFASGIDYFDAEIEAGGGITGGGTGYQTPDGQVWLWYPNAPTGPWYNQWFYDDPTNPNHFKEIWLQFVVTPLVSELEMDLHFTINWTTADWEDTGPDGAPPMFDQEQYIGRAATNDLVLELFDPAIPVPAYHDFPDDPFGNPSEITLTELDRQHWQVDWYYIIPDFNPEWVSIDIWGENFAIDGWIEHECVIVPEPATLVMVGLGLAGFVVRRMRYQAG